MQRYVYVLLFGLFLGCASTRTELADSSVVEDAGDHDLDSNVDASMDATKDVATDAALESNAVVAADSGTAKQLCYVYDDCNGGTYNDFSASGCPSTEPLIGSACTLAAAGECFYCMAGQSALHWFTSIPLTRCEAGLWIRDQINFACE
jgi:hypothetical protein